MNLWDPLLGEVFPHIRYVAQEIWDLTITWAQLSLGQMIFWIYEIHLDPTS